VTIAAAIRDGSGEMANIGVLTFSDGLMQVIQVANAAKPSTAWQNSAGQWQAAKKFPASPPSYMELGACQGAGGAPFLFATKSSVAAAYAQCATTGFVGGPSADVTLTPISPTPSSAILDLFAVLLPSGLVGLFGTGADGDASHLFACTQTSSGSTSYSNWAAFQPEQNVIQNINQNGVRALHLPNGAVQLWSLTSIYTNNTPPQTLITCQSSDGVNWTGWSRVSCAGSNGAPAPQLTRVGCALGREFELGWDEGRNRELFLPIFLFGTDANGGLWFTSLDAPGSGAIAQGTTAVWQSMSPPASASGGALHLTVVPAPNSSGAAQIFVWFGPPGQLWTQYQDYFLGESWAWQWSGWQAIDMTTA
jgi:hypothetical protein